MGTDLSPDVEAFFDIVYNDPELLRAEFDAILAACWDQPPTRPPRPDRSPPQQPAPRARWAGHDERYPARETAGLPARHGQGRQRGPPPR